MSISFHTTETTGVHRFAANTVTSHRAHH